MGSDGDVVRSAYHEAGHAVVAHLLGRPVARLSIRDEAADDGAPIIEVIGRVDDVEAGVIYRLAGRAAEEVFAVDAGSGLDVSDLQAALDFAAVDKGVGEASALVEGLYPRAVGLLSEPGPRQLTERLAAALLESHTLAPEEVQRLLGR